MKKITFIVLLFVFFTIKSYAQAGDLQFGIQGGYATLYKDPLFGLNASYDFSDMFQTSFTGLFNPAVKRKDEFNSAYDEKLGLYSLNLDTRFLIINQRVWAMGPSLGAQYLIAKYENSLGNYNALCFNIGWHVRTNITDNLRLSGGWRYTNTKESIKASHHFFYIGIGYAFNLF
jgi:hypothetical protein